MNADEVAAIQQAKTESKDLLSQFYSDRYVYFVDSEGNELDWKGFSGKVNSKVSAPYVVCQEHTKEAWEKYESEHAPEPDVPDLPGIFEDIFDNGEPDVDNGEPDIDNGQPETDEGQPDINNNDIENEGEQ